jgi:hypothetical protein
MCFWWPCRGSGEIGAGPPARRSGSDLRLIRVGFGVEKVALGLVAYPEIFLEGVQQVQLWTEDRENRVWGR